MDECKPLISGVDAVISYDAPRTLASYLHRVGRGLQTPTFRVIISAFRRIRWVVHGVLVTKTA